MAIPTVPPVSALTVPATSGRRVSELGSSDFLNLLIQQLRNQNPLEPVGGTDFLAQTAQFSSVDSLNKLNTNLSQMLTLQQVTQAAGLIGKRVTYQPTNATDPQTAIVSAVNVVDGTVRLLAEGVVVDLGQVRSIQAA